MVLYTPLLIEEVLKDQDKLKKLKEIDYNGVLVQVENVAEGQYKIVRIISSEAEVFLDPELQPGMIIEATF